MILAKSSICRLALVPTMAILLQLAGCGGSDLDPMSCVIGDVRVSPTTPTLLEICVPSDGSEAKSQAGKSGGDWIVFSTCTEGKVGVNNVTGMPVYSGMIPNAFVSCVAPG